MFTRTTVQFANHGCNAIVPSGEAAHAEALHCVDVAKPLKSMICRPFSQPVQLVYWINIAQFRVIRCHSYEYYDIVHIPMMLSMFQYLAIYTCQFLVVTLCSLGMEQSSPVLDFPACQMNSFAGG